MAKNMEMEAPRIMPQSMACKTGLLVIPFIPREDREEELVLVDTTEFKLGVKVIWDRWTFVNNKMLED